MSSFNLLSRFSQRELRDLFISIIAIGFVIAWNGNLAESLIAMPIALIIVAPAFALHELGHKFVAQKYHFQAQYKMWTQGLLFALVMKLILGVAFIAPGAVYFGGMGASKEKIGKVGVAGPVVNLLLISVFGTVGILSPAGSTVQHIGLLGAYVNSFLAAFNLLPFPPFDGQKVFHWNKGIWAFVLGLALLGFVFSSGAL